MSHLRAHERVPANSDTSAQLPPGGEPPSDETMADLFARMLPRDGDAQAAMAQWARDQKAAMGPP